MFWWIGWSAHVMENGGHLRFTTPGIIFVIPFCLIWFAVGYFPLKQVRTAGGRRRCYFFMVMSVLVFAAIFAPASVDLDRNTGTARIFYTTFLIPRWRTIPIAKVQNAEVENADFSSAIVMNTADGSVQLTPFGQMPGTSEGANAINRFLQESRPDPFAPKSPEEIKQGADEMRRQFEQIERKQNGTQQ